MALGQGWEAHVMVGHETTWGTPVTPTDALEIVGVSGGLNWPLLTEDTFRGRSPVEFFRGAQVVELELETELRYEGYELLWRYLFDKDTVSTVNAIKQHVFEFDDAAVNNVGLTVEVKHGAAGTLVYEGCKIDSAEIVQEIDKIARVRWSLVGQTGAAASPSTPTFPTAPRVRWNEITFENDDVTAGIISASIRITNNYIRDRRQLGSISILEPVPQERTVEGTISAYLEGFTGANFRADFVGDNTIKLELNATSPTSIPGSSPTDFYDMLLEIPKVQLETWETPIPDRSPMIQEFTFKSKKVTAEIAKLTITNARTTVP